MLLPEPPLNSSIDETTQIVVTSVMATIAAATLIFSLVYWKRTGRPTFLVLFAAGGAMMLFEPVVDTVGACWFPKGNSWVVFTAYGRPIPVWLCLTYFFYFGLGVGVTWLRLRNGISRSQLWMWFAIVAFGDFAMEATLLHWDTWIYYADQPLVVAKFPLWWAPVNALIVMVAATAVYRLEDYLKGARQLLIIPICISASAFGNAAAGWPSWFVINTDVGWAGNQIGGLLTYAIAIWLMSGVVKIAIPEDAAKHEPVSPPAPEPREPALSG